MNTHTIASFNAEPPGRTEVRSITYPEQLSVFYRDLDGFFTTSQDLTPRPYAVPNGKEFFMIPPGSTQLYQQAQRR